MRMSSKPIEMKLQSPKQPPPRRRTGEGFKVGNSVRDEEIRRRAYEIYLERAANNPGRDLDDWLQAEREGGCFPARKAG